MNWSSPTPNGTAFSATAANTTQSRTININSSDFISPPSYVMMTPPLNKNQNLPNQKSVKLNECVDNEQRLAVEIAKLIKRSNLKLIAFDFDQTIVSVHTGGFWRDSAEKLAEFVRPSFQYLIPELLKQENLNIAVVTFSPQNDLIKEVLRLSIKIAGHDLNRILIKGNTKEFVDQYGFENCFYNGKEIHIAFCRDYFEMTNSKLKILNENVILIDDDVDNITIARKNGHLAFLIDKSFTLNELHNFLKASL